MVKAESVIALSRRIRTYAAKAAGQQQADLRLAAAHLRRFASLCLIDEAQSENEAMSKGHRVLLLKDELIQARKRGDVDRAEEIEFELDEASESIPWATRFLY